MDKGIGLEPFFPLDWFKRSVERIKVCEGGMVWGFSVHQSRTLFMYNLIKFPHFFNWTEIIFSISLMHECANYSTFSSWNPASNKFTRFVLLVLFFPFFSKLHWILWKEYFSGDDYDDGLYLDITITELGVEGEFFDAWIRSNRTILYLLIQWSRNHQWNPGPTVCPSYSSKSECETLIIILRENYSVEVCVSWWLWW